jgi:hypothetical protein
MLDRSYDCLAEDLVYELFQTLPRVTGERDVVEVEHQSETSCHNRLDSLNLTELPGEV